MIKAPMKGAAVDDLTKVRFPKLASPKMDGFRCILGQTAMTSRFKEFPNRHLHRTLKGVLPNGVLLDGEIVVGRKRGDGVLQRTSSGVTSVSGKPDFRLWVFDYPLMDDGFLKRLAKASLMVKDLGHPQIRFHKHVWIQDLPQLEAYLEEQLELGYEGIFLRDPKGFYKEGKSSIIQQWALKVKPFVDAEGVITGWFEEQENTNEAKRDGIGKLKRSSAKAGKIAKGQLGGFILEDCETRVEVRVGGGFTLAQRKALWKIIQRNPDRIRGKRVRYKKQAVGEKDKPRHPNFIDFMDFRPEWDE